MKKLKKTTVNSLFNSIQFNSIPKIISLIALLFLLLFLVSCSSNEEPESEPKYLELVGLWTTDTYTWNKGDSGRSFEVYNNGNIAFIYSNYRGSPCTNYTNTKKIDDNFDYPYTTKVISSGHPMY